MDNVDDRTPIAADARLDEFLSKIGRTLSAVEARRYLNISRKPLEQLHEAGIVEAFAREQGTHSRYAFLQGSLDDFLKRLLAQVKEPSGPNVLLSRIPVAARHAHCGTVDVVRLILDGKLRKVFRHPDYRGFGSIYVDQREVKKMLIA